VKFTFQNPLREAMARKKVIAFNDSVQLIAAASQIDQSALAEVSVSTMLQDAMVGAGAPARWMKSDEEKAAQAEAMNQQAQMAQMINMVGSGANAAKTIAEAEAKANEVVSQ
jgi:hypothetical protein